MFIKTNNSTYNHILSLIQLLAKVGCRSTVHLVIVFVSVCLPSHGNYGCRNAKPLRTLNILNKDIMDAEVRLVLLHLFAFKSLLAESVQRNFILCKRLPV